MSRVIERQNDTVAVVTYNGLTLFEYAIPAEVFGLDRPELDDFYTMQVCAGEPGPLRGGFGISVMAQGGLDDIATAGTVVLPGWRDRFEAPPEPLLAALRSCHDSGGRIMSVCSGAFVLAATGLLDRRRATTHWMYAGDLARMHPKIQVDPDVLYVDEGSVLTSAGSAAGMDACLHLIREDWGARVATIIARRLVVSPHREGGQAQHITAELPESGQGDLAPLMEWVGLNLGHDHTISSLAGRVHQSPRTFTRRFSAATGTSPGRWVTNQRIARARELLETTSLSVDAIARGSGFGSAISLRHHFRNDLQTTPTAYRLRYRR